MGLLLPIITFVTYYLLKYSELEFLNYLQSLHHYRLLFRIVSLCVLTDLALFYLLLQLKMLRASKGIVMACFIFAFLVMAYRIFI